LVIFVAFVVFVAAAVGFVAVALVNGTAVLLRANDAAHRPRA